MGCSIFSLKAKDFFLQKMPILLYWVWLCEWIKQKFKKSGDALNSEFSRGFLGHEIFLICNVETSQTICDEVTKLAFYVKNHVTCFCDGLKELA